MRMCTCICKSLFASAIWRSDLYDDVELTFYQRSKFISLNSFQNAGRNEAKMPVALLERIPLPSLQTYTFISCTMFTCAVYYAHQIVTDEGGGTILPFLRGYLLGPLGLGSTGLSEALPDELHPQDPANATVVKKPIEGEGYTVDILNVLLMETWCVWVSPSEFSRH